LAPKAAWQPLFEADAAAEAGSACPNMTALHLRHPEASEDVVGNGWADVEEDFTPRRRWTDALLMLRHIFQEWIAPLGDDGNVHAFSFKQLQVVEAWVNLLASNLPAAFGIEEVLHELHQALLSRLRLAHTLEGSSLCNDDWKTLSAPVLQKIAEVGQRDFAQPSACASDTCRLWSLFHILAAEGFHRQEMLAEGKAGVTQPRPANATLSAVRDFVEQFFKCLYCRQHFLEQFDAGSYGLESARQDRKEVVLYFWRLHNAVSVRVAAEHDCDAADRRWPPTSLCPSCWESSQSQWPVLSETKKMASGSRSRAIELSAIPNEEKVLKFLMDAFLESEDAALKQIEAGKENSTQTLEESATNTMES